MTAYRRVLLKLSGEVFGGGKVGVDPDVVNGIAREIAQVVRTGVDAGATGNLPADLKPGRYALMCFVDDLPTWRVYTAAQLDVGE